MEWNPEGPDGIACSECSHWIYLTKEDEQKRVVICQKCGTKNKF